MDEWEGIGYTVEVGPSYAMFAAEDQDGNPGWLHRVTYPDGRAEESFEPRAKIPCRVYWGSHGCRLERGHDGPCLCSCADDEDDDPDVVNVGAPPYYGPDTSFFGEDALAVKGRVGGAGIVKSATPTQIVITTPGTPEEWGKTLNDAGEWEPWDVYAQVLDAPPGRHLEVVDADTSAYPGFWIVATRERRQQVTQPE